MFTKIIKHVLTAGKYEDTKLKRVTLDASVERNGLIPTRCALNEHTILSIPCFHFKVYYGIQMN